MGKNVSDYLKEPYAKILTLNDDGFYSAEILEFPGCFAIGKTADEAVYNLDEAAKSWIEVCLDRGLEIPDPVGNQGYSGKIALRLPKSLHRQAIKYAEREGISLNQFLISAIAARLGAEDLYERMAQKFENRLANTEGNLMLNSAIYQYSTVRAPSNWSINDNKKINIMYTMLEKVNSEVQ